MSSLLITFVVVIGIACLLWWLIGYAAPAELVKPLRIIVAVVLVVWLVLQLLPLAGIS